MLSLLAVSRSGGIGTKIMRRSMSGVHGGGRVRPMPDHRRGRTSSRRAGRRYRTSASEPSCRASRRWTRDALDALRVAPGEDEAEDEAEEGGAGSALRARPGATADRENPRIGMHGARDRPRPPA